MSSFRIWHEFDLSVDIEDFRRNTIKLVRLTRYLYHLKIITKNFKNVFF